MQFQANLSIHINTSGHFIVYINSFAACSGKSIASLMACLRDLHISNEEQLNLLQDAMEQLRRLLGKESKKKK